MPSSRAAIALTDAYRERLSLLRGRAAEIAAVGWRDVALSDLDGTHLHWARTTALRLTELQRNGVRLSAAYLTGFVTIETGSRGQTIPVDDTHIGTSRAGKPLIDALTPTLFTVKRALGQGAHDAEALRLGLDRAVRNSSEDVAFAARAALHSGITETDTIVGWRRVTGGGCGACLASATGAIHADSEVLEVHPACQCSAEPVVRGVRETVHRPTGEDMFRSMTREQQDALFAGSGGAEKADLIRSGEVPFTALVQRDPMAAIPDGITEAPLQAL